VVGQANRLDTTGGDPVDQGQATVLGNGEGADLMAAGVDGEEPATVRASV